MSLQDVVIQPTGLAAVDQLLALHPLVRIEGEASSDGRLRFSQGAWRRTLRLSDSSSGLRGLVELVDNNPLVCADEVSVPSSLETLGSIALAPLAKADLLVETPILFANFEEPSHHLDDLLQDFGWTEGVTVATEAADLGSVLAITALAKIVTPPHLDWIDELYAECYGRSFFVRETPEDEWDTRHVAGKPFALYKLGISPDEPHSLLRVQVMADREGKCGAAQVAHTLNVMCGFEESLPFYT